MRRAEQASDVSSDLVVGTLDGDSLDVDVHADEIRSINEWVQPHALILIDNY